MYNTVCHRPHSFTVCYLPVQPRNEVISSRHAKSVTMRCSAETLAFQASYLAFLHDVGA